MSSSELLKLSCFFILLTFLFQVTSAIECYQCNSEYDPRCGDPFDPYSLGKVNCSMKTQLEHLPGKEPVLCRKTTQTIFGKVRVVRDCGYIQDDHTDQECVKKLGTHEVKSIFCSCSNDLCNSSPSHQPICCLQSYIILAFISMLLFNGNHLISSIITWKRL